MDRLKKIELIQRSLGLRHKLKVHETLDAPETHEDLAMMLHSKWELEDELRAIEEILTEDRIRNVSRRKDGYLQEIREANKEAAQDEKDTKKKPKK